MHLENVWTLPRKDHPKVEAQLQQELLQVDGGAGFHLVSAL